MTVVDATSSAPDLTPSRLRQHLRAATAASHLRLEARLPLSSPTLAHADYVAILRAFYGFYAPLEPVVFAALANNARLALEQRTKLPALRTDLATLCPHSDLPKLATIADLPRTDDASRALGCLYVMEGATLGGQYIAKHLREHLALTETSGAAFFTGYGPRTGSLWRSFVASLESEPERDEAAVVEAANEMFDKLEAWLGSAGVLR